MTSKIAETASDFWLKDSTLVQLESAGVAKVLQSEKYAVDILDTMDIFASKNAKIRTETHEMDVLDVLEDETLESHSMDVLDTMDTLEIV